MLLILMRLMDNHSFVRFELKKEGHDPKNINNRDGAVVNDSESWQTPLGEIEIDSELDGQIVAKGAIAEYSCLIGPF